MDKYIICVSKNFTDLTYGRKYELIAQRGSVIMIKDDVGDTTTRSIYDMGGTSGINKKSFKTIEEYRVEKLNKLLKHGC